MFSLPTKYVGKRYLDQRSKRVGKVIGETDTGNIKMQLPNGEIIWTECGRLTDVDGTNRGFIVFPMPATLAAAA